MTVDKRKLRLHQFEKAHRMSGLPVTMQRRAVFETVLDRDDHPSADQVYETVHAQLPQIARMTVYRILGTFVWLGLVSKTCHPGSTARFDAKIRQHHHLVCLDCGAIIDLEEDRLNKIAWPDVRRLGFKIADYCIHFRGRCAACRQELAKLSPDRRAVGRYRIPRRKTSKPK
jgi:Fur family peroxide stress response transcriptional regulator